MSEELKSCPFCGSDNIMIIRDESVHEVLCQKCGVKSRAFLNKEQAIAWWNSRAAGWIKTSERFPEWDKEVLGLREDGFCDVIWWDGSAWEGRAFGDLYVIAEDVYPYWMSLPEPPETEETGGKEK